MIVSFRSGGIEGFLLVEWRGYVRCTRTRLYGAARTAEEFDQQ